MARPCKIPTDPEILDKILENLALGLSTRLIGNAFGISEETIRGWKRRPDFKRLLGLKHIEILSAPIKATAERFPKDFIERHPETRETFKPPIQKSEVGLEGKITMVFEKPEEDNPVDTGD